MINLRFYFDEYKRELAEIRIFIQSVELQKDVISEIDEYSNAIVHAFQRFRAPFSGKIVHIFPEQSAVI